MELTFDHLVHFTDNPEVIIEHMNELGFSCAEGGQHQNWGTSNVLSFFDLSYIEFLSIQNMSIAQTVADNTLISQLIDEEDYGEGFLRIALRTNHIDQAAEHLKNCGLNVFGPINGKRLQNDGSELQWSMLFISEKNGDPYHFPFIIDWHKTDEERRASIVPSLKKHSHGPLTLDFVAIAVKDLKTRLNQWQRFFGVESSYPFLDQTLGGQCVKLHFPGTEILLVEPRGRGLASNIIRIRGERPYLAKIKGANKNEWVYFHGTVLQY